MIMNDKDLWTIMVEVERENMARVESYEKKSDEWINFSSCFDLVLGKELFKRFKNASVVEIIQDNLYDIITGDIMSNKEIVDYILEILEEEKGE